MKFVHAFFESIFDDKNKLSDFMEWLDDTSSYNDWLIVRLLTGTVFIILLVPIILFWLVILNVEFILSKIIFRQSIKIPAAFNEQKFNEQIRPWLEESLPYFKWTYIKADFNTPIMFRRKFYEQQAIDIRFLTKEERLLFELAWRGNVTFLKNRRC